MGLYRGPNIVKDKLLITLDAMSKRSFNRVDRKWNDLSGKNITSLVRNYDILNTTNPDIFNNEEFDILDEVSNSSIHFKKFDNPNNIWLGFKLFNEYCIDFKKFNVKFDLEVLHGSVYAYMSAAKGGYTEGPRIYYSEGTYHIEQLFEIDDTYNHPTRSAEIGFNTKINLSEIRITNLEVYESGPTYEEKSLHFDGVDDYGELDFITNKKMTDNQSFTIETIVKLNSGLLNKGSIIGNQKYSSENDAGGFGLSFDSIYNTYFLMLTNSSIDTSFERKCPISINYDMFEYIVYVYDSENKFIHGYRNGVLINSTDATNFSWNVSNRKTLIGKSTQGGWTYYNNMNIAIAKIYGKPLNESEILQNFNAYKNRYLT